MFFHFFSFTSNLRYILLFFIQFKNSLKAELYPDKDTRFKIHNANKKIVFWIHSEILYFSFRQNTKMVFTKVTKYNMIHWLFFKTWKSAVDKVKSFGTSLIELSKVFVSFYNEILFAKLDADGFGILALRLVHSYLTRKWWRIKINMSYCSWEKNGICGSPSACYRIFVVQHFFVWSFLYNEGNWLFKLYRW